MIYNERTLQGLRACVGEKFGKNIESQPDCVKLSAQFAEEGFAITPQTFRRIFGLVAYKGGFSKFTMDSLAQYCGFRGLSDYENQQLTRELDRFFGVEDLSKSDHDYWEQSEQLCRRIAESPAVLLDIHQQFLRLPLAREFFIEHHPMRDLACTAYTQFFKEYLKYATSNESKIFAYGFLFIGAFLSENEAFMSLYYHAMMEIPWTPDIYLLPAGRKFGVPLLYYSIRNDEKAFDKAYAEMLVARKHYCPASEKSVCSFEYAVLEHLIFTDRTAEMQFLIENQTLQKFDDRDFVTKQRQENHEEVWKILCAFAYMKMEDHENCNKYVASVDLHKLSVGWVKYYSILYYFAKRWLAKKHEKHQDTLLLKNLISETGFTYYQQFL